MKKIITLLLTIVLLAGCDNTKRQYESIVKTLELSDSLSLETIKKAHLMISEANNFTPEQAIDLQERITCYVSAYAQKEAEIIEEKWTTKYSNWGVILGELRIQYGDRVPQTINV